jgi:LuxR family maltose regulon positive regulatory protein
VLRGVNSLVDTSQVSLWLATGDWAAARRWANGIQAEINGNPAILQPRSEFDETRLIALVRIMYTDAFREAPMMAEKTALTILDQALDLLAHLESAARRGSRTGSLIEILALKALVFYQRFSISKPGDSKSELPAEVGAALDECLALAEPEGYIRTFIDEGESMRHLLVAYGRKPLQLTRKSYIARLLAAFPGASTTGSLATRPGLIEPLSEREQEVLAMIAAGLSSQDIAHKLIVAPGTIKAHIATIYRKLDVHSRTQALAVAKALHLLNE